MVAGAFLFGFFDYVYCFGFLSGGAFVAFGSSWETFSVFWVVAVACWVHAF